MNPINRFLVDKKEVEIEGQRAYKLYFFDTMEGIVIEYTAPIMRSTLAELQEYISTINKQEDLKESIVEEPVMVDEEEVTE